MVSPENRIGLYYAIPIYFVFLVCLSFWAFHRSKSLKVNKKCDALSIHYVGGRDFGPIVSAATLFASLFSGYTVIGVPNEAFANGWMTLRWLATSAGICLGMIGAGFRLHKISKLRNHSSPVDFITDRYQSQTLRYVIVFLQVLPTIIYLAAQVVAIKSTFNNIFGLDPNVAWPTILIMGLILVFEFVGGLNSVALTDTAQAFIMIFTFVAIPLIMKTNFGGWSSLNPQTYPEPEFFQTPSKEQQMNFWQFSLINISFFTLPHFMQRIYAARNVKSLKVAFSVLTVGPWFMIPSAVFMGTVGVKILVDKNGLPLESNNAFSDILEKIMQLGGFPYFVSVIAITGSLAAIMSTADSLIIAISQLISVEIMKPLFTKKIPSSSESASKAPKDQHLVWYGQLVSFLSVTFALLIGLFWDEGITGLSSIQFSLSAQALPAFLFGLFSSNRQSDVHPWNISVGALLAFIYVISISFGYLKPGLSNLPIHEGVTGFCLNIILIIILEGLRRMKLKLTSKNTNLNNDDYHETTDLLYPCRPAWDVPNNLDSFGSKTLTPQSVWKSMEGFYDPMANISWVLLMISSIIFVTPIVAQYQPPIDETTKMFYTNFLPSTFRGLPWWAFKMILLLLIPYSILVATLYKIPNEFPIIESTTNKINDINITNKEMDNSKCNDTNVDNDEDHFEELQV